MRTFADLDIPKLPRQTNDDDVFTSVFLSRGKDRKTRKHIHFARIKNSRGGESLRSLVIPSTYGDAANSKDHIVTDLFLKRQIRGSQDYKAGIIQEFVFTAMGERVRIKAEGKAGSLTEREPQIVVDKEEEMKRQSIIMNKKAALNNLTIEEEEAIAARVLARKAQAKAQSQTFEGEWNVVGSQEPVSEPVSEEPKTQTNPAQQQPMSAKEKQSLRAKEWWANKRAQESREKIIN